MLQDSPEPSGDGNGRWVGGELPMNTEKHWFMEVVNLTQLQLAFPWEKCDGWANCLSVKKHTPTQATGMHTHTHKKGKGTLKYTMHVYKKQKWPQTRWSGGHLFKLHIYAAWKSKCRSFHAFVFLCDLSWLSVVTWSLFCVHLSTSTARNGENNEADGS